MDQTLDPLYLLAVSHYSTRPELNYLVRAVHAPPKSCDPYRLSKVSDVETLSFDSPLLDPNDPLTLIACTYRHPSVAGATGSALPESFERLAAQIDTARAAPLYLDNHKSLSTFEPILPPAQLPVSTLRRAAGAASPKALYDLTVSFLTLCEAAGAPVARHPAESLSQPQLRTRIRTLANLVVQAYAVWFECVGLPALCGGDPPPPLAPIRFGIGGMRHNFRTNVHELAAAQAAAAAGGGARRGRRITVGARRPRRKRDAAAAGDRRGPPYDREPDNVFAYVRGERSRVSILPLPPVPPRPTSAGNDPFLAASAARGAAAPRGTAAAKAPHGGIARVASAGAPPRPGPDTAAVRAFAATNGLPASTDPAFLKMCAAKGIGWDGNKFVQVARLRPRRVRAAAAVGVRDHPSPARSGSASSVSSSSSSSSMSFYESSSSDGDAGRDGDAGASGAPRGRRRRKIVLRRRACVDDLMWSTVGVGPCPVPLRVAVSNFTRQCIEPDTWQWRGDAEEWKWTYTPTAPPAAHAPAGTEAAGRRPVDPYDPAYRAPHQPHRDQLEDAWYARPLDSRAVLQYDAGASRKAAAAAARGAPRGRPAVADAYAPMAAAAAGRGPAAAAAAAAVAAHDAPTYAATAVAHGGAPNADAARRGVPAPGSPAAVAASAFAAVTSGVSSPAALSAAVAAAAADELYAVPLVLRTDHVSAPVGDGPVGATEQLVLDGDIPPLLRERAQLLAVLICGAVGDASSFAAELSELLCRVFAATSGLAVPPSAVLRDLAAGHDDRRAARERAGAAGATGGDDVGALLLTGGGEPHGGPSGPSADVGVGVADGDDARTLDDPDTRLRMLVGRGAIPPVDLSSASDAARLRFAWRGTQTLVTAGAAAASAAAASRARASWLVAPSGGGATGTALTAGPHGTADRTSHGDTSPLLRGSAVAGESAARTSLSRPYSALGAVGDATGGTAGSAPRDASGRPSLDNDNGTAALATREAATEDPAAAAERSARLAATLAIVLRVWGQLAGGAFADAMRRRATAPTPTPTGPFERLGKRSPDDGDASPGDAQQSFAFGFAAAGAASRPVADYSAVGPLGVLRTVPIHRLPKGTPARQFANTHMASMRRLVEASGRAGSLHGDGVFLSAKLRGGGDGNVDSGAGDGEGADRAAGTEDKGGDEFEGAPDWLQEAIRRMEAQWVARPTRPFPKTVPWWQRGGEEGDTPADMSPEPEPTPTPKAASRASTRPPSAPTITRRPPTPAAVAPPPPPKNDSVPPSAAPSLPISRNVSRRASGVEEETDNPLKKIALAVRAAMAMQARRPSVGDYLGKASTVTRSKKKKED